MFCQSSSLWGICPLLLEKYLRSSTIMLKITVQIINILRFLNQTNPKSILRFLNPTNPKSFYVMYSKILGRNSSYNNL